MQRQEKQAVEGIMGSTTDGGGGSKSGSELRQGIISQDGYIKGSALQVVASAHNALALLMETQQVIKVDKVLEVVLLIKKATLEEVLWRLLRRLMLVLIQSTVLHKGKKVVVSLLKGWKVQKDKRDQVVLM